MKKLIGISLTICLAALIALSAIACDGGHTHTFGAWQKNATDHWRVCTDKDCSAKEHALHSGYPCAVCGGLNVVAFYTGVNDQAHVSFVKEANAWFGENAESHNFTYSSTNDWSNLNDDYLSDIDVLMFLDTRPEKAAQREAFERYMKNGGGWIGFHFSAFALDNSTYPQDWDWYHNEFLGSGQYVSNTWEPTTAVLKVENSTHPATVNLPQTFTASACEWYRWEKDLRENPDITILASIDPSSFPLGTGPKPEEIWHSGYYPVVWSNNNYKMVYMNMGHNNMNYSTNQELSYTFKNDTQNQMLLDGMFGFTQI